jgi:hypothetical protein
VQLAGCVYLTLPFALPIFSFAQVIRRVVAILSTSESLSQWKWELLNQLLKALARYINREGVQLVDCLYLTLPIVPFNFLVRAGDSSCRSLFVDVGEPLAMVVRAITLALPCACLVSLEGACATCWVRLSHFAGCPFQFSRSRR